MKKAYIVTGTPGTGKTTFAKKKSREEGLLYVDGKEIIRKHNLEEAFDKDKETAIVDEDKFCYICEELIKESKEKIIIDSHLSQFIHPSFIEKCFVTHCDISTLKKRLQERGYGELKIKDNLEAEIFQVCKLEAEEEGHEIVLIQTD